MKVKAGDIILMEFGFNEEEFIVKRSIPTLSRFLFKGYTRWYTGEELERKNVKVIGKYVKILGPFGYKKYYGEGL